MLRNLKAQKMQWKLINFRTVSHFITAEFLHDLYNRHSYEVNSIRFRNTLCILQGTDFRSYAPAKEWALLERELGERFYDRDPILLEELALYIQKDKRRLKAYLRDISSDLSAKETYRTLVHLHYLALGEIYGINLVQVEHALAWAISRYSDFSQVPAFHWESQQRKMEKSLLQASLKGNGFEAAFESVAAEFGDFGNAYGTGIDFREELKGQLRQLLDLSPEERSERLKAFTSADARVDDAYLDLYDMASKVGELRDTNKLLMGKVAGVRKGLLSRLSALCDVAEEEIRWYSLEELGRLVRDGDILSQIDIEERKKLVIFKREEQFLAGHHSEAAHRSLLGDIQNSSTGRSSFQGIVASRGKVTGIARLVYTASDCDKIQEGDIMVAHGTDFDLLAGIAKSGGIITEEGGILSHASIVSRELAKPCLIQVLGAMACFNNGDLLELDCEKGMVACLKPRADRGGALLGTLGAEGFSSKIRHLDDLKRKGYPVLPGICISSSEALNDPFFEALKSQVRDHLGTDKLIIRQCAKWEDQEDRSFAGSTCSRVVSSDLNMIKKALLDNPGCDLLIQPFIDFESGGVTFLQTDSTGNKSAIVEASDQGPFHAVHGQSNGPQKIVLDGLQTDDPAHQSARLAAILSEEFHFDLDIEWGYSQGALWILQLRPVTAPCGL